jgi:hypothetical protein
MIYKILELNLDLDLNLYIYLLIYLQCIYLVHLQNLRM